MLLARAVTEREEIVRNAWNIYRNPKLIIMSHHSTSSQKSKTRDWISFKIFTYDAGLDQWSCTECDNEPGADLMPLSRVRARQPGLWSLITNAEIIFMNPHWPQPDRNLYLNLHSYFHIICLYECISLVRNTRLSPGLPGSYCHCLNLHFSNNMWLRNENNDWFHVSVQRSKYHHFQSVISNIKFRLCSIVILIQTV